MWLYDAVLFDRTCALPDLSLCTPLNARDSMHPSLPLGRQLAAQGSRLLQETKYINQQTYCVEKTAPSENATCSSSRRLGRFGDCVSTRSGLYTHSGKAIFVRMTGVFQSLRGVDIGFTLYFRTNDEWRGDLRPLNLLSRASPPNATRNAQNHCWSAIEHAKSNNMCGLLRTGHIPPP